MDFSLIEARPGIAIVVLPDAPTFTVASVSRDFEKTTGVRKADVAGRGYAELYTYSSFADRQWRMRTTPVLSEEGLVQYILHTAEETGVQPDAVIDETAAAQQQAYRQMQEALARKEESYRLLLDSIDQGFCIFEMIFDESQRPVDYRFLEVNAVFEAQTGLKDAVGKRALALVPQLEQHWLDLYGKVALTGEAVRFTEGSDALGRIFEGYAFRLGDVLSRRVALLFTDVTDRVLARRKIEEVVAQRTGQLAEANQALSEVNDKLTRSNASLEEFAHAASHDLKEPIRKITFLAQLLKTQLKDRLQEQEILIFDRIENACSRMRQLIDDLLVYSRVSQRPPETETIDLNEIVKLVLEDLELEIEEKKAVVLVSALPQLTGYKRQISQLFQNLLSNALKYSKADVLPRIEIAARKEVENGKEYHVVGIADNGIGFEQKYAENIFQMFTRLHGKSAYSGTGVGLSIVKKVVENHEGFIRVQSRPGEGSLFRVFLPDKTSRPL